MVQEVHCKECDGTSIEFGKYCVNVTFSKSEFCDKCYQTKPSVTQYFFCSEECFIEFIHKVVRKEKIFSLDYPFPA